MYADRVDGIPKIPINFDLIILALITIDSQIVFKSHGHLFGKRFRFDSYNVFLMVLVRIKSD